MDAREQGGNERNSSRSAAACVVALATVASFCGTAQADEPPNTISDVIEALEAAPDLGTVARPTVGADGNLVAELPDGSTARISSDAGGIVSLTAPGGTTVSLTLPEQVDTNDASVAPDGTVVFAATSADGVDVAVQGLDGAVSIQTVVPERRSAHAFTYRTEEGVTPQLASDGGVDLLVGVDDKIALVGRLAPPWAVDAQGAPVATTFSISGNDITQTVATSASTAYPVVADPLLTYGWGVYMNLQGYQWRAVSLALTGAAVGVTTAACLGAKLPAAWAKAVGAACTLIGTSTGVTALISAINAVRNMPVETYGCYQIQLLNVLNKPNVGHLTKVDSSQCLP